MKFSIIYLKFSSSCLYCFSSLNMWSRIWITTYSRCCYLILIFRLCFIQIIPDIDISDIIHSSDHEKSISISQLINGKLLKYFHGITNSASNILLLFDGLPISFALYSKDLLAIVLLLFIAIQAALFSLVSPLISFL